MRRIVVVNHLTLDGVMQGPGRPDEDTRDGFRHGGWAATRQDDVMNARLGRGMAECGALLLGRRTYLDFAGYWPRQRENPYTEVLDRTEKYVVSTTLRDPLPWRNSVLLPGDPVESVAELRAGPGDDVCVMGSGELVRALLRHDLIDEMLLMIHPLILGTGRRLFDDSLDVSAMTLVEAVPTTTGVLLATYRPESRGA
ncbi:dihydrofolate reductase [Stackebrandtia albiflava]|uniref:Dihydrofolate reductase n=1 Tax=Stackebrandtia albiflava TaxID=406432 RepID=A0A562V147_9ACTN|nr:dihydrofolate reductase family protein [Stackebrandtia albiflava]TWJ11650.1 dihydrofolate reductase [Stackebrandtia albiflava]